MTTGDRLNGLLVIVPVLAFTAWHGVRLKRRRAKLPWAAVAGVGVLSIGLLIPWLPIGFIGIGILTIEFWLGHPANREARTRPPVARSHRAPRARRRH